MSITPVDMRVTFGPTVMGGDMPMSFGIPHMEATRLYHVDGGPLSISIGRASAYRDLGLRSETVSCAIASAETVSAMVDRIVSTVGFAGNCFVEDCETQVDRRMHAAPAPRTRIHFEHPQLLKSSEVVTSGFSFDSRIGRGVMRHSRNSAPPVKYQISINDAPHEVWTDEPAHIAAISRKRMVRNIQLPQTVLIDGQQQPNPDLDASDNAFVERLLNDWALSVSGFTETDLNTAAQRIFARLAGQTPET
jgi:hypothetical protein